MENDNTHTKLGDSEEQETVFDIPNRSLASEREENMSNVHIDEDSDEYAMFSAIMAENKRIFSKIETLQCLVTESVELFKNGQTEMHRLITEAQSSRFVASNKRKKRENNKAYTPEDKAIFDLMTKAFKEGTGQDPKMFSQQCNMKVLQNFGHYPGAKCPEKKGTGAFDKINNDFEAMGGEGVPSFSDYFQIAMDILVSFNIEVPEEVVAHHAQMPGVDKSDSNSNISDNDTRGSSITDETDNEDENPY